MVHQHAPGLRAARQSCEVCSTFEPDESGRCPLCASAGAHGTASVVDDLWAQRDAHEGRP